MTLIALLAFSRIGVFAEDSDYEIVLYEDPAEEYFESEAPIPEWAGATGEIIADDWSAEDISDDVIEDEDESMIFSASANDDDNDDDDDAEETEDPDRDPEAIDKVYIEKSTLNCRRERNRNTPRRYLTGMLQSGMRAGVTITEM